MVSYALYLFCNLYSFLKEKNIANLRLYLIYLCDWVVCR